MNFVLLHWLTRKKHKDIIFNVRKQCRMPCVTLVIEWSIVRLLNHRLFTTPRFLYTVSVRSQLKTCNVHCRWICKRSRTVSRFWSKMNADSASNGFVPRWKKIFWYLWDGAPLKSDKTYWSAQGAVLNGCYSQKSAIWEIPNDLRDQIFFFIAENILFYLILIFLSAGITSILGLACKCEPRRL